MDTTSRHRTAFAILLSALLLGITGDALLRWIPWGLNALLWTILVGAAACFIAPRAKRRVSWFALLSAVIAAAGILWRDSHVLVVLDIVLLMLFLPMLALDARGIRLHAAGLAEIIVGVLLTGAQSIAGMLQVPLQDLEWREMPRVGFRGTGVAFRGTLIATPALLIFGALLGSADEDFARVLKELLVFDIQDAIAHIIVTCIIAALCAGFLRSLAFSDPVPAMARPGLLSLPVAETNFALGLINILFALFVGVQFRYFFGAAPAQLAQYARRGFFELVWVVGLVLTMLLVLEWLVSKEHGFKLFRVLAILQVALVSVIAVSAFRRMQLYRDEFGLTRLRFVTTAFMIWLAALLIWFVCSVLTGRRHRFAIGALASGMAVVVALHAINPDAIIVATNVERARAGKRPFDQGYAMSMSDDATPQILANADITGPMLVTRVIDRKRPQGWRTWNLSRARARDAARDYESNATPPIGRPARGLGSTRGSSSSRRFVISRNR